MSAVVQHKSVISTSQSPAITLDSPVTAGNLLIVAVGYSAFNTLLTFEDSFSDSYAQAVEAGGGFTLLWVYSSVAAQAGSLTLTSHFSLDDGTPKHIHLFEVSGYSTTDKQNSIFQESTSNPSVAITFDTTKADEFVFAAFLDISNTVVAFTPGSGYTAGETTNASGFSMFSEFKEIAAIGQPPASASMDFAGNVASAIATFYGSGSAPTTGPTFLGSVTEVDSIPSGGTTAFLGTVKVISSAPAGAKNPYLGRVHIGAPSAGQNSNPTLGEVVVIGSAPAGPDPYLGTVQTE